MKKFKKVAAGILAAVSMTICVAGISASAYNPTVSKSFSFNNATVTGTLFRDSSKAYGTTKSTKSFYKLAVSVSWGSGGSAYGLTTNNTFCSAAKKSGSGTASSDHFAYKDSATKAYTTITGV